MYYVAVTDVDRNVVERCATVGGREHQVTWAQVAQRHVLWCAEELLGRGAWQVDARLAESTLREARAIKCVWTVGTVDVVLAWIVSGL
ncbi:hypothetical protein N6V40_01710 [Glutamicibacter sp. M10]|nr:hypothetical protein [Glutamicibacter sp. M10]UXN32241.1 hypothetical protein N6V40_01710 [Glutamicibacter sp. M10]